MPSEPSDLDKGPGSPPSGFNIRPGFTLGFLLRVPSKGVYKDYDYGGLIYRVLNNYQYYFGGSLL